MRLLGVRQQNSLVTVTVSGSFHRHIYEISRVVAEFLELGVIVLSPSDPRIVGQHGDFLFVASDRVRSIRLVEDRHLASIRASGFLWLVAPDGYVGQSASMEMGFAAANNVPIFSSSRPSDLTLQQYVRIVPNPRSALEVVNSLPSAFRQRVQGFLIDPHASIEVAHDTLERVQEALDRAAVQADDEVISKVYSARDELTDLFRGAEKAYVLVPD